ncbi:MAG: class I SAM-dependent methyltransferase [Novosphingobium sp.]|nr:class I SAM-dependent methyltransferase [Novosphingobium sp.]
MAIGPLVRRAFGRHERRVSELYRAIFVDLDEWIATIRDWSPNPRRILELGCGEGYSTERLVAAFPDSIIEAIDIAPNIGRLYAGPPERVSFRIAYAEEIAAECPGAYDLIILGDVIHHVPASARQSLLEAVRQMLAPGGTFAFKDWERTASPIYFAGYAADRWLTGDRIAYLTRGEARDMLGTIFGQASLVAERSIRPWSNNYAICVRPEACAA